MKKEVKSSSSPRPTDCGLTFFTSFFMGYSFLITSNFTCLSRNRQAVLIIRTAD